MLEIQAEPAAPAFHRVIRGSRVLGFVAIDSTIGGRARGGLRLATDLGEDEIRAAARSMTLKYGLLGLPQGGAKAGIVGDADAEPAEKRRLLAEFAQAAAPLLRARTYIPDTDMGTSADGIRAMMESLGVRVGPREWRANRSGQYTAHSCRATIACAEARHEWAVYCLGAGDRGAPGRLARRVSGRDRGLREGWLGARPSASRAGRPRRRGVHLPGRAASRGGARRRASRAPGRGAGQPLRRRGA